MASPLKILALDASARHDNSISRVLTRDLVAALEDRYGTTTVARREIGDDIPYVDSVFTRAINLAPEQRTEEDGQALAVSDKLVDELADADVLVIGTPIYNFSVPASLKAWVDQIARARVTFRYTENGPEGLLKNKKAYVVVASGGVSIGSPMDFATPWLRHVLAFVGITDVEFIGAAGADRGNAEALDDARARIADLVHLESQVA